ncbi:sarcosine oxidase subunit delta [Amorphus orientalis]|uniref:Sarcosine oxidase subunit delta n=1 Tax=Amorphus orientalis TaxID=649198 RepID=A0AAE4AUZ1_9HYPH|nr:sarcosine oxidase subunit delta [Amorphus orientalis]MDQ0317682.1 sarcosine oxidase subunit delta [Amorphus orientalis]
MRIPCPFCGPRSVSEFTYEGDATVVRPPLDADPDTWFAAVYERTNPRGSHQEIWHHIQGCRSFLRVSRDTATHAIQGAAMIAPEGADE